MHAYNYFFLFDKIMFQSYKNKNKKSKGTILSACWQEKW